jgi:predicted ribosomally synthesized peptide with nif11-like leader
MSTKAVADFILQASENPAMTWKFKGETAQQRIAEVVAAGREQGFDFTAAECRDFLYTARELGRQELLEEELEQVVGGSGGQARKFLALIQDALCRAIGPVLDVDNRDSGPDPESPTTGIE